VSVLEDMCSMKRPSRVLVGCIFSFFYFSVHRLKRSFKLYFLANDEVGVLFEKSFFFIFKNQMVAIEFAEPKKAYKHMK